MRLFVAIDLSEEARAAIAEAQERMARTLRGSSLRLVRPEHMHLTLAFVDSLPDDRSAQLATRLTEDIPEPCFQLAFGGVGVFPPSGAPRVLWLGIVRGEQETTRLQRLVTERLLLVGVEPERRPFHPHLTLARWRHSRPSERPRLLSEGNHIATMSVDAVTLYESRPTPSGPSYAALARARLRTGVGSPRPLH